MAHSRETKETARQLFLSGLHPDVIGDRVGVSPRTIWRWIADDKWDCEREVKKAQIMPIDPVVDSPKVEVVAETPDPPKADEKIIQFEQRRRNRRYDPVDPLSEVDTAIATVVMGIENSGSNEDFKGLAGCASALCKLIELRLKLQPRTAKDLAVLAVQMGVSPSEFATALKNEWLQKA